MCHIINNSSKYVKLGCLTFFIAPFTHNHENDTYDITSIIQIEQRQRKVKAQRNHFYDINKLFQHLELYDFM